jgi:hypothetical protein
MQNNVVLITNNPDLHWAICGARFVEGTSLDVLIAVRDAVHMGSCLLTHPLCGNLRPYQQPFRSVLIEEHPKALVDLDSLSMIEEAVLVYRGCEERLLLPDKLSDVVRKDYSFVDFELMRESLALYGMMPQTGVFRMKKAM